MSEFLMRRRVAITVLTAVVGLVLIVWAALIDAPWLQGLLINVGTSFLLLAPLLFLNQALSAKVDVLDAELRGRVRGLAPLKDALSSGPARTAMLDALLSAAREPTTAQRVREVEFERLSRGDEFERTVALATSLGNPTLFDQDLVSRSVLKSDSANEQFYALWVADELWDRLDTPHRDEVVQCIRGDGRAGRRIRSGSSGSALAQRILARSGHKSVMPG